MKETKVVGTQQYIRDSRFTFEGLRANETGKVLAMPDILWEPTVLCVIES
jgi:hypothetical protein